MRHELTAFLKDESGATAVEYGLILALIFLGAMTSFTYAGASISNLWNYTSNNIDGVVND
ncbi:Flp family type IVb pilin [Altererythrobacter aurantiacus]|uniref:Flp family type IVb pilin n=1 Tax=Parapontixanthobacter aurantiacus TaxID=1463599 RepID=A0A844ZD58_9SPHN|nr:Flp family type IVb pilin [Parapontixanthobacter aurantiacus]MXO85106.1 Flp family type IVb pilin [Parapontixanthobacter aurantiacus]